jgi:signal transduction histidine kinase
MKFILPNQTDTGNLFISFLTLRKSIGFLAFFLAPALVLGSFILDETRYIQVSMSAYYHTGVRNLLVGVICGISLFLFCYHGYKWYDSLLSKLAGLFALGIAFFPTSETNDKSDIISILHYVTSGIFLVILAFMSFFLFTKSKGAMTSMKKQRNRVYRVCGIVIFVSVALIPVAGFDGIWEYIKFLKPTFTLETIALIAFGISWLTKGEAILGDD